MNNTFNDIYIVGNGDFAHFCASYIKNLYPENKIKFCLSKEFNSPQKEKILNLEDILSLKKSNEASFFVAIGYNDLNQGRRNVCLSILEKGFELINIIGPAVSISPDVVLGKNVAIFENTVIQGSVKIGDGNIINASSLVSHHCTIGNYNWITGGTVLCGNSKIENNCFIGANSTIRNGVVIASRNIIGMASKIEHSTKDNEVYLEKMTPASGIKSDEYLRLSKF